MRLIFVRHGETIGNVDKITQGHLQGELTEKGVEQARKVAEKLKDEKIDKIVISDLKRTIDTAQPILQHHPAAEKSYDEKVRERNFGIYEGKKVGAWIEAAALKGEDVVDFVPEKGESIRHFRERVKAYIDELEKTHAEKTVVIVSHGGFITQAIFHILGIPEEERGPRYGEFHPGNTAISVFDFKHGKKELIILNDTSHLSDE